MLIDPTPHLAAQEAALKAALIELVRIPSVCDEGAPGQRRRGLAAHRLRRRDLCPRHAQLRGLRRAPTG